MKRFKILAAALFAAITISGCSDNAIPEQTISATSEVTAPVTQTPITEETGDTEANASVKGFYVSGTTLYDANGNPFVMRGINHAHSWFRDCDDTALEAIAKTGSNCVRIVLANGIQWEKDSLENINKLTDKCKELEMVAILEVHDGTGNDDPQVLEQIADYWIEVKDALIGREDYVILNIANEWIGSWGMDKQWADAYTAVIPRLREAGIKNTLMVDTSGWGQIGDSVINEGMRVFESDELSNTMFSIHMYGTAGGSKGKIKRNIDGVLEKGLCLCIGEFGYTHTDGDVKEDYLMEYCEQNDVGYLGWSWKGNGGGVEYLDIAKIWDGSVLSQDWGEVLINGANGIKETSKKCTVFDD